MGQKLMMIKKHWEHLSKGGSGKVGHYSALKLQKLYEVFKAIFDNRNTQKRTV